MGSCLSKKKGSPSSSLNVTNPLSLSHNPHYDSVKKAEIFETKINPKIVQEEEVLKKQVEEESLVKKEVFVIKHRKSHDKKSTPSVNVEQFESSNCASATSSINTSNGEMGSFNNNSNNVNGGNVVVRTSSCTKEEVDAILIQCGRLSRSNSSGVGKGVTSSGRKYCGSKRSFDFDNNDEEMKKNEDGLEGKNVGEYEGTRKGNDGGEEEERRQHRQRHRQSGRHLSPSSSQGRRRTPSRERDQQNRSGSRERGIGSSSSGRRVSRSPGRRSENNNAPNNTCNNAGTSTAARPAKMVSVPATVSSLAMDKSNNGVETQNASGVKRISVKRNVGAASPRAQSPARNLSPARAAKSTNDNNQQQQPSLSRNSSRKAEHSPYRRNPLSEIDPNSLAYPQATANKSAAINNTNSNSRAQVQKPNVTETKGTNFKGNTTISMENKIAREQQQNVEEPKAQQQPVQASIAVTNIITTPVAEAIMPQQTITRTRSGRRSRDLDINPEVLSNTTPSYTTLLLEDIQNFHQKNNATTPNPPFSLPPCVTKACSILEAVADLNSTTNSNLSCAFSDDRRSPPPVAASLVTKRQLNTKDPIVESEVNVTDDLMEPSFHKYVTVRRGGTLCGEIDMDGQESSGSNSFVGGGSQQHWGYSTSSWEPNSAESTDRWTSRSNNRDEDEKSPLGHQRHVSSEGGREMEEARRGVSGQRTGIGRGRLGGGYARNVHQNSTVAAAAAAAST